MKNVLLFIVALFIAQLSNAQCTVTIDTPTTDIDCGDCFTLTAVGTSTTNPLSEDFNNSALGPGWNSNVSIMYNNPCGPPPDGSPAAWFGLGSQPREMSTVAFDVSCGGDVCWEMKYATQSGAGNCEGPDLYSEGVHFQYSLNGGMTWIDIQYWPPLNGGYDWYQTQWQTYCVTIPPVAATTSTQFRWYQDLGSGAQYDHWGIDNVNISAINCDAYYYDWFVDGTEDNADTLLCQSVNIDTYTVIFTNGIDDTCTASITMNGSLSPDFTYFAPCEGEEVTFTNTTVGTGLTAYWIFLNGTDTIQSPNATYIFPPGSNHDVELYVEDPLGCSGTITKTVVETPKLTVAVDNQVDVTCNSGNDGIVTVVAANGTGPYTYSWTGSSSTAATADDLFVGSTTVTINDVNGCEVTETINIGEPDPLSIFKLSKDTIICIGDPVQLFAQGAGGSSPYTYKWEVNNQTVATGANVTVTPTTVPTQYRVILGEQCGSPQDTAYVVVNYPGEVDPTLLPDITGGCFPVEVNFTNSTNTTETINYTIWTYSDGVIDTTAGANSAVHEFGLGVHNVDMEIVTNRGCRYYKSYQNLIEGYPYPEANFYVNPNPVSVFEPKVAAFSQSDTEFASYQWFAEGAKPDFSTTQNPKFVYPNEIQNYPLILVVENAYGCTDTLQKLVRVENIVNIFTPNSFTPDGDGLNDTWRVHIVGIDAQNFHLQIFNRWGETVFESKDPEGEWDGTYGGKLVKSGTYMWVLRAYDYENDNKHEFKGSINVLR